MIKAIIALSFAMLWSGVVLSEEAKEIAEPPEIVLDAPPPKQNTSSPADQYETITVYESKVLPGFRPCTPEDYRSQDHDPIACQDEEAARVISTRENSYISNDQIVEDDAVPQGNLFKLRFERFKRKKR